MSTTPEMDRHDELKSEFPLCINICTDFYCRTGNQALRNELATAQNISPDNIDGTMIDLVGKQFRIHCGDCLLNCGSRAAVEVCVHEKNEVLTVRSLDSLREQTGAILAGT